MAVQNEGLFIGEALFLLVIMGTFIVLFTYVDITVHDFYALPWGKMCYTGNTNPDCQNIEQMTNCPNGGDACIEARYASMLQAQAFTLGGLMIFIKLGVAKLIKRKIDQWRILQSLIWGATPLVLLWTGWEDFLYYAVRGMQIPQSLPWLDNAGLVPYVDNSVLHVAEATSMSLYIVMAVGFITVCLMIYGNMRATIAAGRVTPI